MQLIGKVLHHGEAVTLRHPDTSLENFICHAVEPLECDIPQFNTAENREIEEVCSWDTVISLDLSPSPPEPVIPPTQEEMQLLLAAHDPDLVARLRAALHLALVRTV